MIHLRQMGLRTCDRCDNRAKHELCDGFGDAFAWYCELCRLEAVCDFAEHRAQHTCDEHAIQAWESHERAKRQQASPGDSGTAATGEQAQ